MATIKQGILGGLSGKVGNVVGGSWKGISYLRSMPVSVKDAKSPGQRTSRMKMMLVIRFLQTCPDFVRVGFSGYAVKMTAFNAATSYNYQHGLTGEYPDIAYNYAGLMVSRGKLTAVNEALSEASAVSQVTVTWTDNSGEGNASASDTALLLVFNPEKNRSVYLMQGAVRSNEGMTLTLPSDFNGEEVHCYLGFADFANLVGGTAKNYISDSVYAGSITVL